MAVMWCARRDSRRLTHSPRSSACVLDFIRPLAGGRGKYGVGSGCGRCCIMLTLTKKPLYFSLSLPRIAEVFMSFFSPALTDGRWT